MFNKFICILAFTIAALAHADVVENNIAPSAEKSFSPREHRGSYLSVNWGLSYLSAELNKSNFGYRSGGEYTRPDGRRERTEHYGLNESQESFSAWGFPSIDIRFGMSFGNLVAAHFSFGGGLFKGEGINRKQDYSVTRTIVDNVLESEKTELLGVKDETFDSYGIYGSLGFGFTIYPFRDLTSPLNGFFVGIAGGVDGTMARDDDYSQEYCTVGGVFTRFELGKDWWVSDTWSIGVGLSFTKLVYAAENEGEEMSSHVISLFFRLTRG